MPVEPRSFRVLVYRLKEIEDALRAAGLAPEADDLARAARLFGPAPIPDFLEESRLVLMNLLLGEPAAPAEIRGDLLDAIAMIDDGLQKLGDA
jgi:hypothetical protein